MYKPTLKRAEQISNISTTQFSQKHITYIKTNQHQNVSPLIVPLKLVTQTSNHINN